MIKQRWEDCTIGFYCPNCNAELVADSQNEPQECDCGLEYSLVAYIKITPPNTIGKNEQLKKAKLRRGAR